MTGLSKYEKVAQRTLPGRTCLVPEIVIVTNAIVTRSIVREDNRILGDRSAGSRALCAVVQSSVDYSLRLVRSVQVFEWSTVSEASLARSRCQCECYDFAVC